MMRLVEAGSASGFAEFVGSSVGGADSWCLVGPLGIRSVVVRLKR